MSKSLRALQSFSNVQPGAVANVALPVNRAYAGVLLEVRHDDGGGAGAKMTLTDMKSNISEIRLRLSSDRWGSEKFWEIAGDDYLTLNDYYGVPSADGVLPLLFAGQYWSNPQFSDAFALGTADLKTAELEVKLASGVSAPEIIGHAWEYDGANMPLGRFIKLSSNTVTNSATGPFEIPDLPVTGNGVGLKALHMDTDAIDTIEVRADGAIWHEDVPSMRPVLDDIKASRTGGRTHGAGYTHLDFAGNDASGIRNMTGLRDFRLKLNMTGTGAFKVVHETIVGA